MEELITDYISSLPKKLVCNYRLPNKSDDFSKVIELFRSNPYKVLVKVKPNCKENNCHDNVDRYVNMYGGDKISGYYLVYDTDYQRFIAIRHSIWRNTYNEILDITPFSDVRRWNLFIESNKKETFINF